MDGAVALQVSGPLRMLSDESGSGIAGGDWEDLFSAVMDRPVQMTSGSGFGSDASSEPGVEQMRERVLECVATPVRCSTAQTLPCPLAKRQRATHAFFSRAGADVPAAQQDP